jgi:alpha-L-fucosidase 2
LGQSSKKNQTATNMKKYMICLLMVFILTACSYEQAVVPGPHDLYFTSLPVSWDEGIPLGNGFSGALVWQKEDRLRISIDRADLWDLRPMENIGSEEWKYSWVCEQWSNDNYKIVQDKFDAPYDRQAAPTKIPAAAIEFDITNMGGVSSVWLDIKRAVCHVYWKNGSHLELFVEATGDKGRFRFSGDGLPEPQLIPPDYKKREADARPPGVISYDLERLGYEQGVVSSLDHSAHYLQKIWGGYSYSADLKWESTQGGLEGFWSVSSHNKDEERGDMTSAGIDDRAGYRKSLKEHLAWWNNFWEASSVILPDSILERQWFLEMYKFGSVARADAPPVSLQAVWTADNGQLPPWKGDFHHDLNTQLSYWPAYSSNHTDLSSGFTNWMWDRRDTFRQYTGAYFETEGINVPGVTTLAGEPMGGWIQYSFGPTVSAWLAQHFYLQWAYTADTLFLKEKAYPWIRDVARHLYSLSVTGDDGFRKFPLSSSPEFNDNRRDAWFPVITNFDLSLTRWTFENAAALASLLGLKEEGSQWLKILSEWPEPAIDPETGLMIAPGYPYKESHRHFSHLMSIFPLGLHDVSNSAADSILIERSLENLVINGSDYWTGYSYAWLGNLYARAGRGREAAEALRIFAECFCLPNSFHVNGDQSGTGKSRFTYRPFTIEGNFAFASGIQEMLLQSHRGMIEVFPAIPPEWRTLSFRKLRAIGAVLVSASMENGRVIKVELLAEKGGTIELKNPFRGEAFLSTTSYETKAGSYIFNATPGQKIILTAEAR